MLAWTKRNKDLVGIAVAIVGVTVAVAIFLLPPVPTWYADKDGDGFGNPSVSEKSIWQPSGFVENADDCYDGNKEARPGAERFFGKHRGDKSFDYNCDGKSTKAQTATGSCSNGTANQGWNGAVPNCGLMADWLVDCDRKPKLFPPKIEVVRETERRLQRCH
ncbi:MAG: hypothetical protein OYH76_24975 [Defluviicoccus sp.]|nr:hypothetical protein [Defluviicoccus sp.]MDE0279162.1 hypothetical protein [Defluviicoccus sp.]